MEKVNKTPQHKWRRLNTQQSSCKVCNVLRTHTYSNKTGLNTMTYQDDKCNVYKEYIPCIEKYDDSEFYK